MRRLNRFFRQFIQLEAAGGMLLGLAALCALALSNSPLQDVYQALLHTHFSLIPAGRYGETSLLHVINDGFMVLFFLLVSLEIKRECKEGQLQKIRHALLPLMAALGGIVLPAVFYLVWNVYHPTTLRGWAIPTATDIAFSLGVLSLFGKRVPMALKLFLTTLAVVDDLVAILMIAVFYTQTLSSAWLGLSLLSVGGLWLLQQSKVHRLFPYLVGGAVLWFCILKSGIHATIAGVLLGFMIPLKSGVTQQNHSLLHRLEQRLHPWVVYGILPAFAFANAGLNLSGMTGELMHHPVFLGIFTGLVLGKPLGIFAASWLAVKARMVRLPDSLSWNHVLVSACLGGIGFTMSLFIGMLAFSDVQLLRLVQLGVLAGSLLSACLAWLLLRRF